jgi:uncharacterized protein (TIGR00730 family)
MQSGQDDIDVTQETAQRPRRATVEQMERIQDAADVLLDELDDVPEGDLVGHIVTTAIKLLRDQTNRGDIKLIDKAVAELRYALKVFAPYRDTRKVSVFGSARTPESWDDYQAAVEFGRKMADRGWMVTTGAGGGIMAAAHGGAGTKDSFGLAIRLPFEQFTNDHIRGDQKLINFKYFFTRKLMFMRTSHAIALFPGGFGTLDEGFEALTLIQTGKAAPCPIVMVDKPGGEFWTQWQRYCDEQLLKRKMISPSDLNLYTIAATVDEAVDVCCRFYNNYHSVRYTHDRLIMRLQRTPSPARMEQVRSQFNDIKVDGDFEITPALKVEMEEVDIAHLPRLVFNFNRRDHGRLRALIDLLNEPE